MGVSKKSQKKTIKTSVHVGFLSFTKELRAKLKNVLKTNSGFAPNDSCGTEKKRKHEKEFERKTN